MKTEATTEIEHSARFAELAELSMQLGATRSRIEKQRLLVETLRHLNRNEIPAAIGWLTERPLVGAPGIGPARLWALSELPAAREPTLFLCDIETKLARAHSQGHDATSATVTALMAAFTEHERQFFRGSLTKSLRQGSLDGTMLLALAETAGCSKEIAQRTFMVTGSLTSAAQVLLAAGPETTNAPQITLFQPLSPMLASTANVLSDTGFETREALLEWKVDGIRAQVHKQGRRVAVYSRSGNDMTVACRDLVEIIAHLPIESAVLDAEVVLLDASGNARAFQDTFAHLASKTRAREGDKLQLYVFDCMHHNGRDLLDTQLRDRLAVIEASLPQQFKMPHCVTQNAAEGDAFCAEARSKGHEGLMVKDLASTYKAGGRGRDWYKVKAVHTVDLVVLAAEWGSGRRKGKLSNLHLGARREDGSFCMVGKTFKGLTDAMLVWQTPHLISLQTEEAEHVVHVRPELVVEVRYNDVQRSSRYPGGIALRFARVVRHRSDKSANETELLATLLHERPEALGLDRAASAKRRRKGSENQLSLFEVE
jgi:DNA ligase 1